LLNVGNWGVCRPAAFVSFGVESSRYLGQATCMALSSRLSLLAPTIGGLLIATNAFGRSECYDAKITGVLVSQEEQPVKPSKDHIYFTFPYLLTIKVDKVLEGSVRSSKLSVMSIQHMAEPLELRTWWLTRNSARSYNRMESDGGNRLRRCRSKAAPPKPLFSEFD
jgi:hypothetical protein